MDKRISVENIKNKHIDELIHHMAVQTLLDVKAIYGRITKEDVEEAIRLSVDGYSVFFNNHLAYIVIGVPSEDKRTINLFLYATTEGYSKIEMMKESLFSIINILQKKKIYSMVYKGNQKQQSVLKANGFRFNKNVCFGKENRIFCLYVKE